MSRYDEEMLLAQKVVIVRALRENNWHVTNTAAALGISRRGLQIILTRHHISPSEMRYAVEADKLVREHEQKAAIVEAAKSSTHFTVNNNSLSTTRNALKGL